MSPIRWAAAAIEILVLQWIALLAGLGLGHLWRSLRGAWHLRSA